MSKMTRASGKEVKVSIKVETGEASENICDLVKNNSVDLVIMAAVSSSGLKIGKMLGSVTDHVCRTVPVPVLLIRPLQTKQNEPKKRLINQILLTLDGSDLSKLALPAGEEFGCQTERGYYSLPNGQQDTALLQYFDDRGERSLY